MTTSQRWTTLLGIGVGLLLAPILWRLGVPAIEAADLDAGDHVPPPVDVPASPSMRPEAAMPIPAVDLKGSMVRADATNGSLVQAYAETAPTATDALNGNGAIRAAYAPAAAGSGDGPVAGADTAGPSLSGPPTPPPPKPAPVPPAGRAPTTAAPRAPMASPQPASDVPPVPPVTVQGASPSPGLSEPMPNVVGTQPPLAPVAVAAPVAPAYTYVPVVIVPVPQPPVIPAVADPYVVHFGQPADAFFNGPGHLRFPYYSYRRPWFFPGPPRFNRTIVW